MTSPVVELAPDHKLGLPLKNPLMVASGFAGYGPELARWGDLSQLGGIATNPVSWRRWPGAPQPRLCRLPGGFLLRTGRQNPGLQRVLRDYSAAWAGLGTAIIVHICGADQEEYGRLATRLEEVEGVAGLEVSLPLAEGGRGTAADAGLVRAVREASALPLLVAVPLFAPPELLHACVAAGANALVVAAPPPGLCPASGEPRGWQGEWFGIGMLPLTLYALQQAAREVNVPLVARGGIHTAEDALACLAVGASAVQVDSVIYRRPTAPWEILEEMESRMGWAARAPG